jgi:hypothetical protein
MAVSTVLPRSAAVELAGLLDSLEITGLIADLEATRWTGRPGDFDQIAAVTGQ